MCDWYWAQKQQQSIRNWFCSLYPPPYNLLAMQGARGYVPEPLKFKRDPVRIDPDEKGPDAAVSRDRVDSEDDDVDVDEDEPVSYKTTPIIPVTEPLKKKWSRQAEEAARQSPPPSTSPQPPAAHIHTTTTTTATSDKGEGGLLAMHSLMDRSLYEKSLLKNIKPNGLLARAT